MEKQRIENIVLEIDTAYSVKRISDIQAWFSASDIDYFIKKDAVDPVANYLKKTGALVVRNEEQFSAYLYLKGELYVIDFNLKADSLTKRFGGVGFKQTFYDHIWHDPKLYKFFKYVLTIRSKEKYTDFVDKNYDIYGRFLHDTTYLNQPIFKNDVSKKDVLYFMKKRPVTLFKVLNPSSLLWFVLTYFTERFKKIGGGKCIAFVGVDGAGKTTVLKEMSRVIGAKVVYMGDYNFTFARFYDWIGSKHLYLARSCFFLQLPEQIARYLKVRWYTIRGVHVLTDRYPGFNRPLRKEGWLLSVNTLLYGWFPQPHGFVYLYAKPEVIRERKQEMSKEHIEVFHKNATKILTRKKKVLMIKNSDLDKTYTEVLRFCFHIMGKI